MAYLWRGIRTRIRRMKCADYVGDCSYCAEWKRAKAARLRPAAGQNPPDQPAAVAPRKP